MKVNEYYPATPNSFAAGAPDVKIPLQMDPKYRDIGSRTKIVRRRTVIKSTNDKGPKKYYSFRAFMTKEQQEVPAPKQPLTNLQGLMEFDDISELPQDVISDLKSLMRRGVNPSKKDLEQFSQERGTPEYPRWKNALELVDTAYHTANIKLPSVGSKGWKQYEKILIPYGVQLLADKYGLHGPHSNWRFTSPIVTERQLDRTELLAQILPKLEKKKHNTDHQPQSLLNLEPPQGYEPSHVGTKRFWVTIPGAGETEVDAKNIDEIVHSVTNKMRRHGVKVQMDQRNEELSLIHI